MIKCEFGIGDGEGVGYAVGSCGERFDERRFLIEGYNSVGGRFIVDVREDEWVTLGKSAIVNRGTAGEVYPRGLCSVYKEKGIG